MAAIASVYVEVLPVTAKIADGISKALRSADSDVIKAAKRWRKEIEKELKDVDVTVDADTAKARKEIKRLEKEKHTAHIRVEVDQASIAKARASLSGVGGGGGGAGKALGSVAKGEGLTAAVGLAPNVVPAIGSVVQAAGQLSGVLGLIPATAGAAGLAIGSLKIATSGFGDAIKEVGDPAKFAEAIKALAPNAQQAATACHPRVGGAG